MGTTYYKPGKLRNDAAFVKMRLLQTRYRAIGYDHRNFDGTFTAGGPGCLTLTKSGLEGNRSEAGAYRLQKSTQISVTGLSGNTLCFDAKGRPHDGDFSLATLLHEAVDIGVNDGSKRYRLTLYPVSGYVTMKKE
ncbi:hypothetical protein [Hydrogenimonas sp.]